METAAIQQFQTHGQDIPWLLEHWAEQKPDHAAARLGRRATARAGLDLRASCCADVRRLAAGLAERGIAKGDKVLIHSENCPEMVLAWLACATLGAVAVTTNTKSVGAEVDVLRRAHGACVAAITQPQYAAMVAAAAPDAEVDRGHRRQQRRARDGRRTLRTASTRSTTLVGDAAEFTAARPSRCSRSGSCSRRAPQPPEGRRAHARQRDLGQPHRARATSTSTTDDTLPDLPAVLPRERAELVDVLGARRRRDGGAACRSGREPLLAMVVEHGDHAHLADAVRDGRARGSPTRPQEHTLRVGVFGLIMPELDAMFGIDVYAAYGMTETVTHAITGKPSEQLPDALDGHVDARATRSRSSTRTPASSAPRARSASSGCAAPAGIQLFLEYFDNAEANAKAFRGRLVQDRRHGEDGRRAATSSTRSATRTCSRSAARTCRPGGRGRSSSPCPASRQVAVVGKQHEFLDEVAVAFVITAPGAPRHADARRRRDHRAVPRTTWPTSRCRARSTSSTSSPPARSTRSSRTSSARWPTSNPPVD